MNTEALIKKMAEKKIEPGMLAEKINVSKIFVYYLMNGQREPSLNVAKAIADTLECTVDELI